MGLIKVQNGKLNGPLARLFFDYQERPQNNELPKVGLLSGGIL